MDAIAILAEHDAEVRAKPFTTDPAFRFEWDGPVFRFTGSKPRPSWNGVTYTRLDGPQADGAIARQIAHFDGLNHSFEWKLYAHDRPADLGHRLEAAGLTAEDEEGFAVMALTPGVDAPRLPPGVTVRVLAETGDIGLIAGLNEAVYGPSPHAAELADELIRERAHAPGLLSIYGAFAEGILVSAGWIRFQAPSGFASLWGGATLAEWRGRGVYSALVASRAREARAKGYRWLTVDCSPASRPILERRGFRVLSVITPWIWKPSHSSVA